MLCLCAIIIILLWRTSNKMVWYDITSRQPRQKSFKGKWHIKLLLKQATPCHTTHPEKKTHKTTHSLGNCKMQKAPHLFFLMVVMFTDKRSVLPIKTTLESILFIIIESINITSPTIPISLFFFYFGSQLDYIIFFVEYGNNTKIRICTG